MRKRVQTGATQFEDFCFPVLGLVLTPGQPGQGYNYSTPSGSYIYTRYYGGGGGGVLVNNEGPGTGLATSGKGYGGGRGYQQTSNTNFHAGVILIEVEGQTSGPSPQDSSVDGGIYKFS